MDGCIFCMIASGEIPSETVLETEDVRVVADISPANPGHLLVIPKRHADDFTKLDEASAVAVIKTAQRVVRAMNNTLHPDGINVLQNNGEAAGQTVRHYHMHLIPRYVGDTVRMSWVPTAPGSEAIHSAAAEIRAGLGEA